MDKTSRLTACVFCGSSPGSINAFQESAKKLGGLLANSNIELVYGGGDEGLMGTLASSYLQTSNKIKGVIPHFLKHSKILDIIKLLLRTFGVYSQQVILKLVIMKWNYGESIIQY